MQKHTFKDWLTAVRPWSFPASAMPVAVTLGYLFSAHADMDWTNGVWALLNIIVFHAAGNTWSDYFDFRKRVDADDTFGVCAPACLCCILVWREPPARSSIHS